MKTNIDLQFSAHAGHRVNASDMWKDLVVIDNIRLVARRGTAVRRALFFAEKYGLIECNWPYGGASYLTETRSLVKSLFRLGGEIKKLARRDGHPEGKPTDVFGSPLAPIGVCMSDLVEVDTISERTVVSVSNLRRSAELSFHLSGVTPSDDCKNCGEIIPKRAGSRFCSDYCRDVSKKKTMRDAAKKEKRHAVEQ